jgi:hypothetical protein
VIFTKAEVSLIRRGRKTMLLAGLHRDPLTGREKPRWARRYRVGEDIAVQLAAGAEPTCRIIITHMAIVTLADLDLQAARALGHRTRAELADDWMTRKDSDWPVLQEAICDRCDGFAERDGEPCPDCDYGVINIPATTTDDQVLGLFTRRHGRTQVWAVHFNLATDLPNLVAAAPPDINDTSTTISEHGYTTKTSSALAGEPEAVDDVTQARLTREAHERDEIRQQRRLSERLADLEDDPTVHRQLASIERRLRAAELVQRRKNRAA